MPASGVALRADRRCDRCGDVVAGPWRKLCDRCAHPSCEVCGASFTAIGTRVRRFCLPTLPGGNRLVVYGGGDIYRIRKELRAMLRDRPAPAVEVSPDDER